MGCGGGGEAVVGGRGGVGRELDVDVPGPGRRDLVLSSGAAQAVWLGNLVPPETPTALLL